MWELDYKKAEHWRTDAFELWCWRRLLRVPWTARRSNLSIVKKINIGRTDAEAETPILWPPDVKSWLIGKDLDAGKDWRCEKKGTTEDEMVGWHHRLNGHEFEWTPIVGDGQGGLECCSPWACQRVRHDWVTELNWTENSQTSLREKLCVTKRGSGSKVKKVSGCRSVVSVCPTDHPRKFITGSQASRDSWWEDWELLLRQSSLSSITSQRIRGLLNILAVGRPQESVCLSKFHFLHSC